MSAKPWLVLASASPRRLELLKLIGVTPDAVSPTHIDETERKGELPRAYALRVAREKAEAGQADGAVVLAADTVVACGRRILPKTDDEAAARACLELLSGRAHVTMTAVAVAAGGIVRTRLAETRVIFKRLSATEIEDYLRSDEWRGKAGGYAIQGRAATFVRHLSGSHSAVVGLPLYETARLLEGAGYRL